MHDVRRRAAIDCAAVGHTGEQANEQDYCTVKHQMTCGWFHSTLSISSSRPFAEQFGKYGVFPTDDGAIVRHHTLEWLDALLAGFQRETQADVELTTMNGHHSTGVQFIARKPELFQLEREPMSLAG
jgi:hypothetical protein